MRNSFLTMLAILATAAISAAEKPPRNPFWDQGYEGTRRPISAEPRFKIARETANSKMAAENPSADEAARRAKLSPAEREAEDLDNQLWARAANRLDFGATMFLTDNEGTDVRASIVINDLIYGIGDLISFDYEGTRFTWKIESISPDGKLKLKRLIHRTNRKNHRL